MTGIFTTGVGAGVSPTGVGIAVARASDGAGEGIADG
jgi:hypothetical protein